MPFRRWGAYARRCDTAASPYYAVFTARYCCAELIHEWHKVLLHQAIPPLISKWQAKLGVTVAQYFLLRMKTKWGSCDHRAGHIRLNTELVKKPKCLLEYVIVHEMVHLLEPTHSERFMFILGEHYPTWREARAELNELPLSADDWKE